MSVNLQWFAGDRALEIIREGGLRPEMVRVLVSAAGGPRWLIYYHLDRFLFSSWLRKPAGPIFLLGSSIGAWRFSMACRTEPATAIDEFLDSYLSQRYSANPSPDEVSRVIAQMLDGLLDDEAVSQILNHPSFRLNVMAARCKWPVASDNRIILRLGLIDAVIYNSIRRSGLGFLFERALFFDSRDLPPYFSANDLPMQRITLSMDNLKQAVLASSSIPLVMPGVRNIPQAPKGTYRDGGMVDYHFDLPFVDDGQHLALYPHYTNRIIPSWFDKGLAWRKPNREHLNNVVLFCPSEEFLGRLPLGKVPDRNDFWHFKGRDEERTRYWKRAADEGERIAAEFADLVENGRIREQVRPFLF